MPENNTMKVLLAGYFGEGNAGDDMFVKVSQKYLKTRHVDPEIWLTARSPWGQRLMGCRTVPWIPKIYPWQVTRLVSRCDALIFAGGSNFHSSHQMRFWSNILDAHPNCRAAAVGVSIGPFRDADARASCQDLLARMRYIGFRDRASHDTAAGWNLQVATEFTFDLAVQAPIPNRDEIPAPRGARILGISLCPYESLFDPKSRAEIDRVSFVAHVVSRLLQSGEFDQVRLISLNRHARLGDESTLRLLGEQLGRDRVDYRRYTGDPDAAVANVSGTSAMIAMRLHAAVFAYMCGVPCIAVPYHPKCRTWGQTIGSARHLDPYSQSVEDGVSTIRELLLRGTEGLLPVEVARARSQANWRGLEINQVV
jgi:polysaccharide pyruvyl transferase WcaK-like protein